MKVTGTGRHDERIDTVLHALGNGTPPEGMELRISETVKRAAAGRAGTAVPRGAVWWTSLLRWRVALPVRAALLVSLLLGSYAVWHQPYRRSNGLRAPQFAGEIAGAPTGLSGNEDAAAAPFTAKIRRHSPVPASRTSRAGFDSAPQARVPEASFPAPPLPMTQQEQLLLKLVRRSDPVLIASLTPEAREDERRREKEEVRKFFAPPKPQEPPPLPDQIGQ